MFITPPIANDNSPAPNRTNVQNAQSPMQLAAIYEQDAQHSSSLSQIKNDIEKSSEQPRFTSQRADLSRYKPVWQPQNVKPEPHGSKVTLTNREHHTNSLFIGACLVWVASLLANIWALTSTPVNSLHLSIALITMWSSLFVAYFAHGGGRKAVTEMAGMAALLSFALSLHISSLRFGLFLSPVTIAGLTCFAGLALAYSLKSKLALRLSAITGAACIALAITGQFEAVNSLYVLLIPTFGVVAAKLAQRLSDAPGLLLAILASYAGLSLHIFMISPLISSAPLLSVAMLGLAHNRYGKFAETASVFGGHIHRLWGWIAGMSGLLGLLMFWQSIEVALAEATLSPTATPAPNIIWGYLITCSVIALSVFELKRAKLGYQGFVKALIMSTLPIIFIFAILNADTLSLTISSYTPTDLPVPTLLLSGLICTIGFGQLINGLRQSKALMVLFALLALGTLFSLAGADIVQNQDSGAVFLITVFICSLISLGLTGNARHPAFVNDHSYA